MGWKTHKIEDPKLRQRIAEALGSAASLKRDIAREIPRVALPKARRIRQDHKPPLNKLETEWLDWLEGSFPGETIYKQAIRFRLANGSWYKPDFAIFGGAEGKKAYMTCWEVKGPHAFRGGFDKLKMAASQYPQVCWILSWKDKEGIWQIQDVLP